MPSVVAADWHSNSDRIGTPLLQAFWFVDITRNVRVGVAVGVWVGVLVGALVGDFVGALVGDLVGAAVGDLVGAEVGAAVSAGHQFPPHPLHAVLLVSQLCPAATHISPQLPEQHFPE